ncbi:PIN domain-containing protein [Microvirga calopogonii]|uniref:PIN domain-containing protein n=1 Tax=Microvirga calopogonii TaxID=2078013 RepID=UPI000E0DEDC6|nr:PIN domain-containing protein [Microvirga calopogonii]
MRTKELYEEEMEEVADTLHLFIDTNVLLSFYATAKDDLEELNKIIGLIEAKAITLYLPDQVKDEWLRNREVKLAKSIDDMQKAPLNIPIPRFMVSYEETAELRKALAQAEKARAAAINKAKTEAIHLEINADWLVQGIFAVAEILKTTPEILSSAQIREAVGNPPGKPGSLGDRLNWEHLLAKVPPGVPLHIVSKDGDFGSPFSKESPHQFLKTEWDERKKAALYLHPELRPFLQAHFPQFKFAKDIAKQYAVDRLVSSKSYSQTRKAIANLLTYLDVFTESDISRIIEAGYSNPQIFGIGYDLRVQDFYSRLILPRFTSLSEEQKFNYQYHFDIDTHDEDYQEKEDSLEPDYVQLYIDQIEDEYLDEAHNHRSRRDEEDDTPF